MGGRRTSHEDLRSADVRKQSVPGHGLLDRAERYMRTVATEQEAENADDAGLACARLARNDVQPPWPEADLTDITVAVVEDECIELHHGMTPQ